MGFTPLPVRESQVMGRLAVFVLVAWFQLVPVGALFGIRPSDGVTKGFGGSAVPVAWVSCYLASGFLMVLVSRVSLDRDKALMEIAGLVVFTAATVVYFSALVRSAGTLEGQVAFIAVLGSLATNCTGRVALLVRQLRRAAHMRKVLG